MGRFGKGLYCIGEEVSIRQIQHQIDVLLNSGVILKEGDKRWTKYSMNEKLPLQVQ